MRIVSVLVISLLLVPSTYLGAGAPSFESGNDESIVSLTAPTFEAATNLEIPAGYYVKNATMQVTGMAAEGDASAYPENVTVKLNDTLLWSFSRTGYGPLGMQNQFSTGHKTSGFSIPSSGGSQTAYIRFPKEAVVLTATMELMCSPCPEISELVKLSGETSKDMLGSSVSNAGDVNNDGYDDVIVGAPYNDVGGTDSGRAYIFFGGRGMDSNADVILTGAAAGDNFGLSVSGAGDVNNDGYADVVVGAPCNDTGGTDAGRVYLYYGGASMDSTADVILTGAASNDYFGHSVSGAGNVNNDGYDDVILGAYNNASGGTAAGRAYICYGGASMDNTADVILTGKNASDRFGWSVSDAGDANNDGYEDVIVGAPAPIGDGVKGWAYLFFGGPVMDNTYDVIFTGESDGDGFGWSVSGTGDVNCDGYDDVIVGAKDNPAGGMQRGRAYIYFGGANIDNNADVVLDGEGNCDQFGTSVSGAGDVNNDGYEDSIVGAWGNDGAAPDAGRAYAFYGGPNMNNIADITFTGASAGDCFGVVSDAGDVNCDHYDDVVIGAPNNYGGHTGPGSASLFSSYTGYGTLDPALTIESKTIWNATGYYNGSATINDFAALLNEHLNKNETSPCIDFYGNRYVDVPVRISSKSRGNFTLSNLQIKYQHSVSIQDFGGTLSKYLFSHQDDKGTDDIIEVPLRIRSQSAGRVGFSDLTFTRDLAPGFAEDITSVALDEDTADFMLMDLYPHFDDDIDPDASLKFTIAQVSNSTHVAAGIWNNRYLAANADTGESNDNWTGNVGVKIICSDRWGQKTESNEFNIIVKNVNDPPEITSTPVFNAEPGMQYHYNVTAVDGDGDILQFKLVKTPVDMTIDSAKGIIQWLPRERGVHEVKIVVEDSFVNDTQNFTITVPNRPPRITSEPPLNAPVGVPYFYNVTVEDLNLDEIDLSLPKAPEGMNLDALRGRITWIPTVAGTFDVQIKASDAKERTYQNFTIYVVQGNRFPEFKSTPVTTATVDTLYQYTVIAKDPDSDKVSYSIETGPEGMTVDSATGKVSWKPAKAGNFTVVIAASDGKGGVARQEFVIRVQDAEKPQVALASPAFGTTLKDTVKLSGTVVKGTREVVQVQLRLDGGEWKDVVGTYSWQYTVNTRSLKNGKHAFEFRAYDGKEYSDVISVEFKVDNAAAKGKGFIPMIDVIWGLFLVAIVLLYAGLKRNGKERSKVGR